MTATPLPRHTSARTPHAAEVDIRRLTRLRWAVRAVLTLGVAASIAANVLHARPNLISQIIAAWPPLALLLTVELISRVPADRRGLAAARLIAAAVISGIAAWVSYWHMVGVAARYGETDAAASYLLPISVDGLVVVASISLVEIAARIRTPPTSPVNNPRPATPAEASPPTAKPRRPPTQAPISGPVGAQQAQGAPPSNATNQNDAHVVRSGDVATAPVDTTPFRGRARPRFDADRSGTRGSSTTGGPSTSIENSDEPDRAAPSVDAEDAGPHTGKGSGGDTNLDEDSNSARVPSDTAGAVAYWYRYDSSLHPADIATRIGRSERTVRRYWPPAARTANRLNTSRIAEHAGVGVEASPAKVT
ncbi:DUF2637 domain-containing protein [Micromonospora sp. HK10]|uniref:DUF2637 domain-containing protein n=1 Tax=Micromonospora sp. HK10 TaxID=1538294 RepID=UPI0009E3F2FE|nr:DUF2637 domain-containing protein [Micromonospora sp. HK10]